MENGGGSMIHIIVTSHGGLAEGLMESSNMLIGEQENVECITFAPDMGAEELDEIYAEKITEVSNENQYLILCDIKGGTPFNVVSRYSFKNDNVTVIYGVNLPTLVTALLEAQNEGVTLAGLAESLQQQFNETIGVSDI